MAHDCHVDRCKRDREGFFIPSILSEDEQIPPITIQHWREWNGEDKDYDLLDIDAVKFAKFCYHHVAGNFMTTFRDEYKRLAHEGDPDD